MGRHKQITDKLKPHIEATVKEYISINGRKPQLREFKRKNGYSFSKDAIIKLYGTFNNLLVACGYEPQNRGQTQYNIEELLNKGKHFMETQDTTNRDIITPLLGIDRSVIERLFGSWETYVNQCSPRCSVKPCFRRNFTTAYDGHICDSNAEAIVDNWLHELKIPHTVHAKYPNSKMRCDFKIGDIYIEYAGMYSLDDTRPIMRRYQHLLKKKLTFIKAHNLKCIVVYNTSHASKIKLISELKAALGVKPIEELRELQERPESP